MTSAQPLRGLRVLDFAWIGAGALVTKALAEMGAEILRVESHARPDNLRMTPPFRPGTDGLEASGYFASRNPGKKSVALNMKHPKARSLALRLAAQCDVFTSNFRPGVLERWGLAYDDVRAVNDAIVFLVMPMQGMDGPHKDFIGFGSTIAALAGLVHPSGLPDRQPVGTGTHYPDHVPNPGHALVALLAAVYHQRRTGEGQLVELSQYESTVNVMGPGVLQGSLGETPPPLGNQQPGVAPRGAYRCADGGFVVVACHTEDQWSALTEALEHKEWLADPRFATLARRTANADELDRLLAAEIACRTAGDVLAVLAGVGVPSAKVNDSRDLLADPRLAARGFWQDVEHPVIGTMPMFHAPIRFGDADRADMTRPPLLGEHTREVAADLLEIDEAEYEALVDEGVFH